MITLNNGIKIPMIGLGTHRMMNPIEVTYNAIKEGIRLIDTATRYKNQKDVGEGVNDAIIDKTIFIKKKNNEEREKKKGKKLEEKEGICKREDLIIVGKVWIEDRQDPERALRETLDCFGINYIDIYLDHYPYGKDYRKGEISDPFMPNISIYEFWPKMEALVDKGLAKAIGVSNYNVQALSNLLSFCRIKPVVNEVEFNPYYYQKDLKDFCDKENIVIIAYTPLVHGIVARTYIAEHNGEFDVFEEKIFKELAEKYNKNVGQIILSWLHHIGVVPIPATSKEKIRIKQNIEGLNFQMEQNEYDRISQFCENCRQKKFVVGNKYFGINNFG